MKSTSFHLILFASLLALSACQPTTTSPAPPDPAKDIEAVKAVLKNIERLWTDENITESALIDSTLTYYADDCVRLPPGIAVEIGKDAARKRWENFHATGYRALFYIDGFDDVQVSGDLAFARYNVTEPLVPKAAGERQTLYLKSLTILKRQSDGSWKIILHTWNDNAPPN